MTAENPSPIQTVMDVHDGTTKQPAHWEVISIDVVGGKMRQCLDTVMKWQEAELPSRFAIGSRKLRKVTICVREQPLNFLVIIHQSIVTAKNGEVACRAGWKATRVLLEEEDSDHPEEDRTRFTTQTLETIKKSASDLNQHTSDIQIKFRQLRTVIFNLHKEMDRVKSKRERAAFLARLSRHLSKDIRTCEDVLRKVHDDLEIIEETLNLITRWWQKVESETNYLQMNGESPLALEGNRITLKEIEDGFTILKKYFDDYVDQMSQLYDENFLNLSEGTLPRITEELCKVY